MAGNLTGPEQAREDLARLLSDGRVELGEVRARMAELGHPPTRVERAGRALDVRMIRQGKPGTHQRFSWELPDACPTCQRPWQQDSPPQADAWTRNTAGNGDYWRERAAPIELPSVELVAQPAPPPLPRLGPPRCSACGRASASAPGERCPYQSVDGRRCVGTVE
jgi:hypothetical protein